MSKARDYKMVYREHLKTLDLMIQSSASVLSTEEDANKLKKEIASFEIWFQERGQEGGRC